MFCRKKISAFLTWFIFSESWFFISRFICSSSIIFGAITDLSDSLSVLAYFDRRSDSSFALVFNSTEKLWKSFHSFSVELNTRAKELSDLRSKYSKTDKESERTVMAPKIIELEKNNLEMKNQLSEKMNQVRKAELNFLQNRK